MIDKAPETWHDIVGHPYVAQYDSAPPMFATPDVVTKQDADAQALRSFWRGMTTGFVVIPAIGLLAIAFALALQ